MTRLFQDNISPIRVPLMAESRDCRPERIRSPKRYLRGTGWDESSGPDDFGIACTGKPAKTLRTGS